MNMAIDPEALEDQNAANRCEPEFHFNVPPRSFDGNESVAEFLDQMHDFVALLSKLADHEGIHGTMTVDIMSGLNIVSEFLRTGKTRKFRDWSPESAPELIDEFDSGFAGRLRDDLDEDDLTLLMRIAHHALLSKSSSEVAR